MYARGTLDMWKRGVQMSRDTYDVGKHGWKAARWECTHFVVARLVIVHKRVLGYEIVVR